MPRRIALSVFATLLTAMTAAAADLGMTQSQVIGVIAMTEESAGRD